MLGASLGIETVSNSRSVGQLMALGADSPALPLGMVVP